MVCTVKYPHQQKERIWNIVADVPYGQVVTYGDVAHAVRPKCSPRFIGWALSQAPPNLGLPWHRVLAVGGRVAVTGSKAVEQKSRLKAEGVKFQRNCARLELHRFTGLD